MSQPFFSILLPTKNRSEIVGGAIESALQQTFGDFELIVSDNDDSDTATAAATAKYSDPRIRYHRTSGKLAMHENWDNAFSLAQGKHVLILEDKTRLVPRALEILRHYLEKHGDVVLSYDIKFAKESHYASPAGIPKGRVFHRDEVIGLFCEFEQKFFSVLPKGLDSCAPRELLTRIKAKSPTGFLYSHICPDYASAFMILSETPEIFYIDDYLVYIPNNWMWQSNYSNGQSSYKKDAQYKRFYRQVPVPLEDILAKVPVKTQWLWINAVVYDFQTKFRCPECPASIDWIKYHGFCILMVLMGKKVGGDMSEEIAAIKASLRLRGMVFTLKVALDALRRLVGTALQVIQNRFR